jgi:hypothetical protein
MLNLNPVEVAFVGRNPIKTHIIMMAGRRQSLPDDTRYTLTILPYKYVILEYGPKYSRSGSVNTIKNNYTGSCAY